MSHISRERQRPSSAHQRPWSVAGSEPRLEDVLADPLVHQVMRRDGIEPAQLRRLIEVFRARRRARAACCLCAA